MDEKRLRRRALRLMKRTGCTVQQALDKIKRDYDRAQESKQHQRKPRKIRWNRIPIIAEQKRKRLQIKKAVGEPKVTIVSGGAPGLGKR